MDPLIVAGGILVVVLGLFVGMYNSLVRARNYCDDSWADVDTELQRRHDLIPALVNTVKGYAAHERGVFEEVTRLREACVANRGLPRRQAASENELMRALNQLLARVEAYPELKANANFLELQRELANTEDRIQAARRFYNGNVRDNNNKVQLFPSSIFAALFGFAERQYFELRDAKAASAPDVKL